MGDIKTYSVTLDEEVVEKAKEKIRKEGGKLSPKINNFLIDYIGEEKDG